MNKIILIKNEAKALLEFLQETLEAEDDFLKWEIVQTHESGIGASTEVKATLRDDKTVAGVFRNITDIESW